MQAKLAISIHALREEGDLQDHGVHVKKTAISIHALREEGDPAGAHSSAASWRFLSTPSARRATVTRLTKEQLRTYFYPRPPRGGRLAALPSDLRAVIFLSTPSARRATYGSTPYWGRAKISIHALREEGDHFPFRVPVQIGISIHALREEGDVKATGQIAKLMQFLSTPSARRATG